MNSMPPSGPLPSASKSCRKAPTSKAKKDSQRVPGGTITLKKLMEMALEDLELYGIGVLDLRRNKK